MTHKIHKAQLEVWEWKDTLYQSLQSIPREKWAEYLNDSAKSTVEYLDKLRKDKEKQTAIV
jgi:hypothetical protein